MLYARQPRQIYKVGDTVTELREVRFDLAPTTVILWLNSRCEPCHESIPFYRRLISAAKRTRVVVVGPEPAAALNDFLSEGGISANQVVSVGRRPIKLWATPTVVVVDTHGMVRAINVGGVPRIDDELRLLRGVD